MSVSCAKHVITRLTIVVAVAAATAVAAGAAAVAAEMRRKKGTTRRARTGINMQAGGRPDHPGSHLAT